MIQNVVIRHVISNNRNKYDVGLFNEYGRRVDGTNGIVCKATAKKFAASQPAWIRAEIEQKIG